MKSELKISSANTRYKSLSKIVKTKYVKHNRYLTTAFLLSSGQTLVAHPAPRHLSLPTCTGLAPSGRFSPVVYPTPVNTTSSWYFNLCEFFGPFADFVALSPVFPRKRVGSDARNEVPVGSRTGHGGGWPVKGGAFGMIKTDPALIAGLGKY